MNIYRVTFIGHRDIHINRELNGRMEAEISELVRQKEYVEFYIGRNGVFDIFVASIIKRVQNKLGKSNNSLTLVLPYKVKDIEYYEKYYDDIIIPIEGAYFKSAITERNRWLVDNADLLIAYVSKSEGGAADCLKYARKQGLKIINYADKEYDMVTASELRLYDKGSGPNVFASQVIKFLRFHPELLEDENYRRLYEETMHFRLYNAAEDVRLEEESKYEKSKKNFEFVIDLHKLTPDTWKCISRKRVDEYLAFRMKVWNMK